MICFCHILLIIQTSRLKIDVMLYDSVAPHYDGIFHCWFISASTVVPGTSLYRDPGICSLSPRGNQTTVQVCLPAFIVHNRTLFVSPVGIAFYAVLSVSPAAAISDCNF